CVGRGGGGESSGEREKTASDDQPDGARGGERHPATLEAIALLHIRKQRRPSDRIMPSAAGSECSILLAVAKRPEVAECVNPVRVPAFKRNLQRVLAPECYVLDAQLVVRQGVHPVEPARCSRLATAPGAGARPAQLFTRI